MSIQRQYGAMPTLMGAPTYGRRRSDDDWLHRPLGVDDLPLERLRSEEDRQVAEGLGAYPARYAVTAAQPPDSVVVLDAGHSSKPGSLRVIAGRFLGRGGH